MATWGGRDMGRDDYELIKLQHMMQRARERAERDAKRERDYEEFLRRAREPREQAGDEGPAIGHPRAYKTTTRSKTLPRVSSAIRASSRRTSSQARSRGPSRTSLNTKASPAPKIASCARCAARRLKSG